MFDDHQFDAQQVQSALPDYKFIKKLGVGSYGKVFLVEKKQTNEIMAMKKIKCFGLCDYQKTNAANEVRLLASMNHSNVIKFHESLFDNTQQDLYIFMEYASEGDLSALINEAKEKKRRISQALIWKIISQLSDGLNYLHKNNIMHRDIKPANIFRAENQQFKLADLNVSKILPPGLFAKTQIGSPLYTSPQIWNSEQGYNQKCDIWSLGVVLYELCTLKVPYQANSIDELIRKLKTQRLKNIPNGYSSSLNELIHQMLQINPKKRISAEKIHNFCQSHVKSNANIQTEVQPDNQMQSMLDTIIFPENVQQQRWVNLVPLPPKLMKKESSDTVQKQKSRERKDSFISNRSNIFAPLQNRSTMLRKSRSKKMINSQQKLPRVRLPSIKRNSSQSQERKSKQRNYQTPERSRKQIQCVKGNKAIVPLPNNPSRKLQNYLKSSGSDENSLVM